MMNVFLVALGGAIGAIGRYGVSVWTIRQFGAGFPIGTLLVNVIGSALMGVLVAWLASKSVDTQQSLKLFLGVGILGGFTTFSAFTLESFVMLEDKAYGSYMGYVSGSIILSLLALFMGFAFWKFISA